MQNYCTGTTGRLSELRVGDVGRRRGAQSTQHCKPHSSPPLCGATIPGRPPSPTQPGLGPAQGTERAKKFSQISPPNCYILFASVLLSVKCGLKLD